MSDDQIKPAERVSLLLHAEDVAVSKRVRTHVVRVRSETATRDVLVDEPLLQEGVVVERVAMDRFVDAIPPVRQEGDVTVLSVVEEVLVIERRLRVTEEVRIRRVQSSRQHTETVTLREQRAVVTRSEASSPQAGLPNPPQG